MIIGVLNNGLDLLNVSAYWQTIVKGSIIVIAVIIDEPEPDAPFGAKGVGEPPTISSTPAVVSAIRAATGLPLTRVPVRPDDIALGSQ